MNQKRPVTRRFVDVVVMIFITFVAWPIGAILGFFFISLLLILTTLLIPVMKWHQNPTTGKYEYTL